MTPRSIHAKSKRTRRHNRQLQASIPTARILLKFNELLVARGGATYRPHTAVFGFQVSSEKPCYPEFYPGDFRVFSEPISPHPEH